MLQILKSKNLWPRHIAHAIDGDLLRDFGILGRLHWQGRGQIPDGVDKALAKELDKAQWVATKNRKPNEGSFFTRIENKNIGRLKFEE